MFTGIFFTLIVSTLCSAEQMTVAHAHTQQVNMRIAYIGCTAQRMANVIAADMRSSGHYAVDVQEYRAIPRKKEEITNLAKESILFLLMLESQTSLVSYRLYDTTTGLLISKASGKCMVHNDTDMRYGHHIADLMWRELMGVPSIFNTRIAYAKEMPYKKGIAIKHICTADYDGRNEETMVKEPTISIAPRWGGTKENPLIFYSEFTETNVRITVVNARKKRAVFTRCDGNSMHLIQNYDRSMRAFSASRGDGRSHIYLIHNKKLTQCTFGETTDACPTFNHDGSIIYYCSDAMTGSPHIMAYSVSTKEHESLPISGFCVTPAYNPKKNLIAYSKMVDGCMQICVFDTVKQQEKQITWDACHHEGPTWSPCGAFLAYTHQVGSASRVRMHCYATGHEQYITPVGVNCSYPAWSLW
jgi:TolB protein